MGLDNPEPGSAFGSVASTLAKITGYGLSAAGIPIGPMLLGGTGMYDAHVERGRQGKTIEYLTSMYPDAPELPILRQMATSGTLDTRSAMEYLASGRARRAYGAMGKVMEPVNRTAAIPSFSPESFAGASPSDVVPGERQRYDASEFYQDVPTTTERFTRAGGMNLPPDVTAKVYELLMGHQGRAEPNVPADIQRRQAAGSYGRALEETGVKPEAAAIGAEAWSRDGTVKMPDRRDAAAQQLADELAAGTWDVATAKGRLGYQTRAAQLRTPPAALATNFPALRQEAETERLKTELLPQFQQRAQQIQSDPKLPEAYKRAVGWAMDQFEANPTEKAAVEVRRAIAQQDQAMARAEQSNARLQLARERIDRAIGDKERAILCKEKASTIGTVTVAGKTKKAPSILGVLGNVDYKFIIEIGADVWQELPDPKRVALLDHHLCGCKAVEDADSGNIRFFVQPADVSFYKDEVARHGFWRTSGSTPSPTVIKDLFGEEEDKDGEDED